MTPLTYARLGLAAILFATGFAVAWSWQAGKVEAQSARADLIQAKFGEYVAQQIAETATHAANAAKLREETANAWALNLESIRSELSTVQGRAAAYRRCVAAGRCGPLVDNRLCIDQSRTSAGPAGGDQAGTVPATGEPDEAGANAVSFAEAGATNECEASIAGLILDAAVTTAQLNALQADIERQAGY